MRHKDITEWDIKVTYRRGVNGKLQAEYKHYENDEQEGFSQQEGMSVHDANILMDAMEVVSGEASCIGLKK